MRSYSSSVTWLAGWTPSSPLVVPTTQHQPGDGASLEGSDADLRPGIVSLSSDGASAAATAATPAISSVTSCRLSKNSCRSAVAPAAPPATSLFLSLFLSASLFLFLFLLKPERFFACRSLYFLMASADGFGGGCGCTGGVSPAPFLSRSVMSSAQRGALR